MISAKTSQAAWAPSLWRDGEEDDPPSTGRDLTLLALGFRGLGLKVSDLGLHRKRICDGCLATCRSLFLFCPDFQVQMAPDASP